MPAPGGRDFLQAYNCQAVVDSAHQVIVAAQATNQTSDKQQAVAMVEETIDNVGAVPKSAPVTTCSSSSALGRLSLAKHRPTGLPQVPRTSSGWSAQ